MRDLNSYLNHILIFSVSFIGKPTPRIEWRMGDEVVSSKEPPLHQAGVVGKKLKLAQLKREHHAANLTCLAFNSNLTDPLSESLRLVLYCTCACHLVSSCKLIHNLSFF